MPVFVDALFEGGRRNAEGTLWSHMFADTSEELHAMAEKIGRNRCWFHRGNHYDLTPSFREKAVAAGAIEWKTREEYCREHRAWRKRWDEGKGKGWRAGG